MASCFKLLCGVVFILILLAGCAKAAPTESQAPLNQTSPSPTATARVSTATPVAPTSSPIPATATVTPTASSLSPTITPEPTASPTPPTFTEAAPTATARPPARGASPPKAPSLGDAWLRAKDGMIMVYVPGGTFQMGSEESDPDAISDELPQHTVSVDGFWMDQTEVTNAQFAAFLNEHGNAGERGAKLLILGRGYCQIRQEGDEFVVGRAAPLPVVMVTGHGADAYCQWVGGRLPTEAEWEYAARGPEGHIYPWGDDPPNCELARYGDCVRSPIPVGSLPLGASWCGALDMAGNVWEWVADWYGPYPSGGQENPTGPVSGWFRVLRGGGWHSPRWEIRTTFRLHDTAPGSYNG